MPPAYTHQPFDFTRIHKHGLEGQHSVPRDVSFLSWSSGVSGRRRLLGCIGVLHYLLRHALGAPHPCVFLTRGFGHQGLVAACVLLGLSFRVHLAHRMPHQRTNQTRMHHWGVCTALLLPTTLCIQMHLAHRMPRQRTSPP